jgi:ribosome-binding protein aMBF1 (putative translation factor)
MTQKRTRSNKSSSRTRDAVKILGQVTGDDETLRELVAKETLNARVAQMLFDARSAAGLTQAELAKLVGTKQPVIARLEDADYEGHSLSMLQRIAEALGARLEVRIVPIDTEAA